MCCSDNSHLCDLLYAECHVCSAYANGDRLLARLLHIVGFIQDHNIVLQGKSRLSSTWLMNVAIFWDTAPSSPCYGGTYRLHLQGQKSRARKRQNEPSAGIAVIEGKRNGTEHTLIGSLLLLAWLTGRANG
jgi:hypothetical protein